MPAEGSNVSTEDPGTTRRSEPQFTIGEEIANSVTHGVGAVLSLAGLVALLAVGVLRGGAPRIASFAIYGATLVLLHLASTLYHALRPPKAKRVFRIFDHAAIYLVIAGTYTPFTVLAADKPMGWIVLGVIWALAITGVVLKSIFLGRLVIASTVAYALMGWAGLFMLGAIHRTLPWGAIAWLLGGGFAYTLGIIFFAWKRLPFAHMVWHLLVLIGVSCHFVSVLVYL
ncbi:MAG: hemolysin III family protein [Candidatus Bipolaricaulota bacterium]|nr:MAG: hemolysin III family protein [Candidatus Bipolaricaulota bacterium]